MKPLTLLFIVSGLAVILITPTWAQVIELPEIEIVATRYKYLDALGEEASVPVQQVEEAVADFDVQSADFYQDEYDTYRVAFYIPEGRVLAAYDNEGRLLRTAERFKDVKLPKAVLEAVAERFPNWGITKDVYLVNYHENTGKANKRYKLTLENGDKRMRVKVDENGKFL